MKQLLKQYTMQNPQIKGYITHYLAYDSHYPPLTTVKSSTWTMDWSKNLITWPWVIPEEKMHLSPVLVSSGYPYCSKHHEIQEPGFW